MLGKIVKENKTRPSRMQTMSFANGLDLHSFEAVELDGWFVRVSVTNIDSILVVMQNPATFNTKVGFFFDELEANKFINFWISSSIDE